MRTRYTAAPPTQQIPADWEEYRGQRPLAGNALWFEGAFCAAVNPQSSEAENMRAWNEKADAERIVRISDFDLRERTIAHYCKAGYAVEKVTANVNRLMPAYIDFLNQEK